MRNWTIAKKTCFAVFASYIIIVAAGWQLYTKIQLFIRTANWVSHTNTVTASLDEILLSLVNMETGLRGYAVGGDKKFLEPYEQGKANFAKVIASTSELVADNPKQVERLKKLASLQAEWVASDIANTISMRERRDEGVTSADAFQAFFNEGKGKLLMDAMRAQIKEIKDTENSLLSVRSTEFTEAAHAAQLWVIFGLATAVAIGAVLVGFVVIGVNRHLRKMISDLHVSADSLSASAAQFSASSQTLASGASEQAASLEETSASLEELSSMTKRNADSSQQAKQSANDTRASADAGAKQVMTMQAAMQEISRASVDISKILKTIDEIAFQTNILALNAAVEAARAGSAGAGFAVVADEVRALAQRCATAAKETAEKIEDCVAKSKQGVDISAEVAASFVTIQQQILRLDTLVAEIATASTEQNQGLSQVSVAVSQMDKITQSNAGAAEESASASQELQSQSSLLSTAVTGLQSLVGGAGTRLAHTPDAKVAVASSMPARKSAKVQSQQDAERTPANACATLASGSNDDFFRS